MSFDDDDEEEDDDDDDDDDAPGAPSDLARDMCTMTVFHGTSPCWCPTLQYDFVRFVFLQERQTGISAVKFGLEKYTWCRDIGYVTTVNGPDELPGGRGGNTLLY